MAKEHKGKSAPAAQDRFHGDHGGNRGGDRERNSGQPKKSSQAAGKDANRGTQ